MPQLSIELLKVPLLLTSRKTFPLPPNVFEPEGAKAARAAPLNNGVGIPDLARATAVRTLVTCVRPMMRAKVVGIVDTILS